MQLINTFGALIAAGAPPSIAAAFQPRDAASNMLCARSPPSKEKTWNLSTENTQITKYSQQIYVLSDTPTEQINT